MFAHLKTKQASPVVDFVGFVDFVDLVDFVDCVNYGALLMTC